MTTTSSRRFFALVAFLTMCLCLLAVDAFHQLDEQQLRFRTASEKLDATMYFRDPPVGSTVRLVRGPLFAHRSSVNNEDVNRQTFELKATENDIPCRLVITYPSQVSPAAGAVEKKVPVIVYLGGMLGLVPIEWYADLNRRMAYAGSLGSIVISLDMRTYLPSNYSGSSLYVDRVVDWVGRGGLVNSGILDLSKWEDGVEVLEDRVFLAAHSSGAQSTVDVWQTRQGRNIAGMILLDPVDAMGTEQSTKMSSGYPFMFANVQRSQEHQLEVMQFPPPVTDPKNPRPFAKLRQPVLMFKTGLCGEPTIHLPLPPFVNLTKWGPLPPIFGDDNLWPACCPRGLGPDRFWQTLTKSTANVDDLSDANENRVGILWDYTKYGHCDILDDRFVWVNNLMRLCKSVVDVDKNRRGNRFDLHALRKNVAALVSAFVDHSLGRNVDIARQVLIDRSWSDEDVKVTHVNV